MNKVKVLIVDDEEEIVAGLQEYLAAKGFVVDSALDGDAALKKHESFAPGVILLDVRMPGVDGMEVCEKIRKKDTEVVIILVTAVDADINKVKALNVGADDYVTKPFSTLEIEARINAHLRRVGTSPAPRKQPVLKFGTVSVDRVKRQVTNNSEVVKCTQKEFDLLCYLIDHQGEALHRDRLLEDVWGQDQYPTTRTVDIHIMQLRKKLEVDPSNPRHFLTVHGIGYKFEIE